MSDRNNVRQPITPTTSTYSSDGVELRSNPHYWGIDSDTTSASRRPLNPTSRSTVGRRAQGGVAASPNVESNVGLANSMAEDQRRFSGSGQDITHNGQSINNGYEYPALRHVGPSLSGSGRPANYVGPSQLRYREEYRRPYTGPFSPHDLEDSERGYTTQFIQGMQDLADHMAPAHEDTQSLLWQAPRVSASQRAAGRDSQPEARIYRSQTEQGSHGASPGHAASDYQRDMRVNSSRLAQYNPPPHHRLVSVSYMNQACQRDQIPTESTEVHGHVSPAFPAYNLPPRDPQYQHPYLSAGDRLKQNARDVMNSAKAEIVKMGKKIICST